MRTKRIYAWAFGLILAGLSGCAVTDFDRTSDFSKYKTFVWGESDVDVSNPLYDSDLIDKRIKNAVEQEFAKRGIVRAQADPDFVVRFHTFTEEKKRSMGVYPYRYRFYPYGFFPFAFAWGYPYYWMSPPNVTEYTEGTLIIDIVDHGSGELVWRGSVRGDVDDTSDLKKQIEKGIRAIMKKYPVRQESPLNIGQDSDAIS